MRIFAFCIVAVLGACSPAAEPPRSQLLDAMARYDTAWIAKDTATLAQLMAPEFVYFTSSGGLVDQSAMWKLLLDRAYVLTEWQRSEQSVTISGDVARVSSHWIGTGRWSGGAIRDDQTCGQTWIWRDARWLLFTEHCANRD